MKRMLFAMAVMSLAVGSAQADWGGFGPPAPQGGGGPPIQPIRNEFTAPNTLMGLGAGQPGRAPDRYGLMPGLRKAFRVDGGGGCSACNGCNTGMPMGHGGHGQGGGYGPPQYQQYPPVNQGTLVFPNHQFVRSPRDFFMYEPGK